jgi:hypothetical protein
METTILFELPVTLDGTDYTCPVIKRNIPQSSNFSGNKIHHPYKNRMIQKKGWNSYVYDEENVDESVAKILSNCERFDIKHDGACGALIWNDETHRYVAYTRYDIKKNKDGVFAPPKDVDITNWIPCEEKPTAPDSTHYPHFRPITEDPKQYKWQHVAIRKAQKFTDDMKPDVYSKIVTIEYMGKYFNGKTSDMIGDVGIVLHGTLQIVIPKALRTVHGIRKIFESMPVVEGIVCYPEGSSPMKIRAEMYEGLEWGNITPNVLTKYGYDGQPLSANVLIHDM